MCNSTRRQQPRSKSLLSWQMSVGYFLPSPLEKNIPFSVPTIGLCFPGSLSVCTCVTHDSTFVSWGTASPTRDSLGGCMKSPGITQTRRYLQMLGHCLCKHTQTAKQRGYTQLEISSSCQGKGWCPRREGNVHTAQTDGVGGINTPAFGHFLGDY